VKWAQCDKTQSRKNCSSKRAKLQHTIQYRTVLIISPYLQTTIIAQMLSVRGQGRFNNYSLAGLRVWNSLPTQLRESDNFDEHSKSIYLVNDSCSAE